LDWLPPACLGIFVLIILFVLYSTMSAASPEDVLTATTEVAGDTVGDATAGDAAGDENAEMAE
jgi:hypothetical protein